MTAIRRREFVSLLGGAALIWPQPVRAQPAAMPVIGFLRSGPEAGFGHLVTVFRQGLGENGYTEGRDASIEVRWANDDPARLSGMAADLVRRRVAAIVVNYGAVRAAMAATRGIPIVFASEADPIAAGLVASLRQPGGNVTGVSFFDVPVTGKRLGLLHELVPKGGLIAALLDPNFVAADAELRELEASAQAIGRQILVAKAASAEEFDGAFATISSSGARALLVGGGPVFIGRRQQLVALATRLAVPATYVQREFVEAGGLMSYGASQTYAYRRAGGFVGRILKGEKPANMAVELPTKFEMIINTRTARTLGLTIPPGVRAMADEMIE